MKKLSIEGCLVFLESLFSNFIILYFLLVFDKTVDWDFLLKGAFFVAVQFPIILFWAILHIVIKHYYTNCKQHHLKKGLNKLKQ